MIPGRKLDALVAEKVMKCKIEKPLSYAPLCGCLDLNHSIRDPGRLPLIKNYSTDIAAAWEVVEKLTSKIEPHFQLGLCDVYTESPKWHAELYLDRPRKRVFAKADTAPHAICLAALKAVGVEI